MQFQAYPLLHFVALILQKLNQKFTYLLQLFEISLSKYGFNLSNCML